MTNRTGIFAIALLAAVTAAGAAQAHTGGAAVSGFSHGFLHPFGGLDHLLAMTAVGLFACILGGRALAVVPAAFIGMMAVGGIVAFGGIALPFVETGIALSVVVIGGLVALGRRMPVALAAGAAGLFAVFHGHAHGAEMPAAASAAGYAAGFIAATAILHGAGILAGLGLSRLAEARHVRFIRAGGAAVAAAGLALMGGAI